MSIDVTGVRKRFGSFAALAGVDLHVPRGQLVALLGPSGSGKTSLLRIIAGLDYSDDPAARIHFFATDVTPLPARERGVGFVFQQYALFRHLSVFDNVAFGLRVRPWRQRVSRAAIRERVDKLLHLVQLEGLERRYPAQLSGGQRQRVALARALAVEPRVLLLDEPFGALDAKVRKELRRWLRQLHEEIHLTTVFVTHDQEEALELADQVVILDQGKVVQVGTPQEIYDRPASPFVYGFLGSVNVLATRDLGLPGPAVPPGVLEVDGKVYVRPHDIEILPRGGNQPGAAGVVKFLHSAGPVARVTLEQVGNHATVEAELSRSELQQLNLKIGDPVTFRPRQIRSFGGDNPA